MKEKYNILLGDIIKVYSDSFVYNDDDSIILKNEMTISLKQKSTNNSKQKSTNSKHNDFIMKRFMRVE